LSWIVLGASDGRFLSPEGCTDKTRLDAVLMVDPSDERWIWAVDRASGQPIGIRIGGGYGVQEDPPAIIDPNGDVIGRPGDRVVSACRDVVQGAFMIDEGDIEPAGAP
jgi:hypothetical protein